MARILNGGACLPDEAGWQHWAEGADAATPVPTASDMAARARGAWIGLPARHVLAVPVWLHAAEPGALRELVRLQLERRGVACGDDDSAWAALEVCREGDRTLATAFVVSGDLPAPLLQPDATHYDVAARFRPTDGDGYALWREQGGIAASCWREGRLAYLHFFPGAAGLADVAAEVGILRRWLAWEGVMPEEARLFLWGEFDDAAPLREPFDGAPPVMGPLPPPLRPDRPLPLAPPAVRAERTARAARRNGRALWTAAALAYLALVLAATAGLAAMGWKERALEARLRAESASAEPLLQAAARWRALLPAIDASWYPMECLLACVRKLPPEVRLTEFDHAPGKVLILGEAKDVASTFRYADAVKSDPLLRKWSWQMPQPQLLANNRAQFRLEGTRATPHD